MRVAVIPYYDDGTVTIYHGDCRELMQSLAFDVVVTDPPYGTGHYETDTGVFDGAMLRSIVDHPSAVFGWPEKLVGLCVDAGVKPDEWITWWPTNGAIRGFNLHGLWRESEVIGIFGKFDWGNLRASRSQNVELIYNGPNDRLQTSGNPASRRMGDVWRQVAPGLAFNSHQRLHPNEKPVDLMVTLLSATPEGIILDPFAGSGPTLRAAKDLGRKAIGIEIVEAHCETAARRLAQGALDFGAAS